MTLDPGTQIGHYKVVSQLGAGGMGEVYRAEDLKLDRIVALKVLPEDVAKDQDRMQRFVREAKAASALNSSHVAQIYEIGNQNGQYFIAMEYVEGQTLQEKIRADQLKLSEILDIAISIAQALDDAHEKGIIHRDIKPANIIMTSRGQVKVLDFGLAKIASPLKSGPASEISTMAKTKPGVIFGTVHYMSPEQALGKEVDRRTDIFSFGVMVYEMTAGRVPFSGETTTEIMDHIIHDEPDAIARFNYNTPAELERIIRKCLEKDPSNRYQSSRELFVDLKNLKRNIDSGTAKTHAKTSSTKITAPRYFLASLILIVLAIAGVWLIGRKEKINSLAILPFANTTKDSNSEYLSDGITEGLINEFSQAPNLRVMARATVFTFKGRNLDPRKVGQDLKVSAILTGKLSQKGEKINLQAELVNVADGSHMWGESYEARAYDILSIQDNISKGISEKLNLQLNEEKSGSSKGYPRNKEAYRLYLKGRYHWNLRTDDDFQKALEAFNQAIQKEPNYAAAYSGLADSYVIMSHDFRISPAEYLPKARNAAYKAVQFDPQLAEARTSLAAALESDWKFTAAEKEFKRSIELNPNYSTARQWYAEFLFMTGRLYPAIQQTQRALESDPLSLKINSQLGNFLLAAREYDEAIEQLKKTLQMGPDTYGSHLAIGAAYAQKGMYGEAIAEYQQDMRPKGAEILGQNFRTFGYAEAVKRSWKRLLDFNTGDSKTEYIAPELFAEANARIGNVDEAFHWLQKLYDLHSPGLPQLIGGFRYDPEVAAVRKDPRYDELMKKIGLPTKSDVGEVTH